MTTRRHLLALTATCLAGGVAPGVFGQAFPARPVRIIVAAPAGGGDDIPARLLAAKLSEVLGQQVVVENKPGVGGMIGQTTLPRRHPMATRFCSPAARWRARTMSTPIWATTCSATSRQYR